jgi:hypothetical protein
MRIDSKSVFTITALWLATLIGAHSTMAWAESISDPKRRRDAVLQVAKVLRSHDPQAYTSYIEHSSVLTDKERDKLLGVRPKEQAKDKDKPKDKIKKEKKIK